MKRQNIPAACLLLVMLASCGGGPRFRADFSGEWPGPNPKNKRGVAFSFEGKTTVADMDLLGPAIKWFYNWAPVPKRAVVQPAKDHNLIFFPMAWNEVDEFALRKYKEANPDCEYLLAYNEPNLTDQANMTPSQAAKIWPRLVKIAKELDLKIVSPAMNFGTLNNYGDPIKWLDEFFSKPGVNLDDISAIAIHCYMNWPSALKWYISIFKKYGKPIWMTEFCAWEYQDPILAEKEAWQMKFISEAVAYMELDPQVERYAWFIPRGAWAEDEMPYNNLLTKKEPIALTGNGLVYVNMGPLDKDIYTPAGQVIEAEHFSDNNVSLSINSEEFFRPVHFRPSTDSAGGILEMHDFTPDKWVDYQVETPADKTYTLTLRNTVPEATTMNVYVDGNPAATITLNQTDRWTTGAFPVTIPAGKHVIRLEVTAGDCTLNWLKVE